MRFLIILPYIIRWCVVPLLLVVGPKEDQQRRKVVANTYETADGKRVNELPGVKPSNTEQNKVVNDVNKAIQRGKEREEENSSKIKVEIEKREDAQRDCTN